MKIAVDTERCIGAGQCVVAAPELFDQREEDGIVILLDDSPDPGLEPAAETAAALCPATAIRLIHG